MRVNVKHPEPAVVDEPDNAFICASNVAICAWRSEIASAFAGVAKENAKPKTMTTDKRIAATFFVANALLIVCFDFFIQLILENGLDRTLHPFDEESCTYVVCLLLNNTN